MGLVACNRLFGRNNLIRRREFTLPTPTMTTEGELAVLGFAQTEHLHLQIDG